MADNVTAPAKGAKFATDEIGTGDDALHWPYAKLAFGPADTATIVRDADGARLPVKATIDGTPTVALDAPSLAALETVELGATSLAALESIGIGQPLPAGGNNIGDVDVASVPAVASTTRAYAYAAGQRLTTSGAGQVRSAALAAEEVLLHASGRGFFRVGDNTVAAGIAAGSIPLEAGEKFHLRITSGQFISWIRDGGSDVSLTIMPVA